MRAEPLIKRLNNISNKQFKTHIMVKYQLYLNVNPLNPKELVLVKESLYCVGRLAEELAVTYTNEAKSFAEQGYISQVMRVEQTYIYQSKFDKK